MYRLKKLPYKKDFQSKEIFKYLSDANFSLGELKGLLESSTNLPILLKYIGLFEAKMSADIENINTDYKSLFLDSIALKKTNKNSSIVVNQLRAVKIIYRDLLEKDKLFMEDLNRIQELIVSDNPGLRKVRGHKIYNKINNKVLYIPPQNKNAIVDYYQNLIDYINMKGSKYDPLIKMSIIYYQFKCIEPYKDGNGRICRIISMMALIKCKRLKYPIINLIKYFYTHREEYFSLLEKCNDDINHLDEFIIFVLKGIHETSNYAITLIHKLNKLIGKIDTEIKEMCPTIYSPDLVKHIFMYPYTKNELVRNNLNLSRSTSTKHMKILVNHGFLDYIKWGKEAIYINKPLDSFLQGILESEKNRTE